MHVYEIIGNMITGWIFLKKSFLMLLFFKRCLAFFFICSSEVQTTIEADINLRESLPPAQRTETQQATDKTLAWFSVVLRGF